MSDILDKINKKPYIIAEVSQNHDGSLGQAHAFIDAVADAGADAIKFQTHIAREESTKWEEFRVPFSYEDKTRFDYWERMEFTEEQWQGLYNHANERGLDFLSSPFSIKALELLDRIGVPAWKFGAGEVFNAELMERAIATGKPILISTGLSTWKDIDEIAEKIKSNGNELVIFHCVTAYPSTADMIDIKLITEMKKRYDCIIGISDHSSTIYPALSAVTLGAQAVEVHVTMSPYMFGPDVKASVTLDDLHRIVEGSVFIHQMNNTHIDMGAMSEYKSNMRTLFSKSYYYVRDLEEGHILTEVDIALKKPNNGVDTSVIQKQIGKQLNKKVLLDDIVRVEDFR